MMFQFVGFVSSIYPPFSLLDANHRDENKPISHPIDNDFDTILQSPLCDPLDFRHLFFQAIGYVLGIQILLIATFQKMPGALDLHADLPPLDKVMFLIQSKKLKGHRLQPLWSDAPGKNRY
jgi:hypothetical protein